MPTFYKTRALMSIYVGIVMQLADLLQYADGNHWVGVEAVISRSILMMSASMPWMSASMSSSERGGEYR